MAKSISQILGEIHLPFLLIGGHSLAFYGYPRNTLDIDFLVSEENTEEWFSQLRRLGYVKIHHQDPFAQFTASGQIPIDLMIVSPATWEKLLGNSRDFPFEGLTLQIPAPEHLVALKLHSATSPYRAKVGQDWEDIRQLVILQNLDPKNPSFRDLILRYGNEECLHKIEGFCHERGN